MNIATTNLEYRVFIPNMLLNLSNPPKKIISSKTESKGNKSK